MDTAIEQFNTQFLFIPVISNKENLQKTESFIVCGMGGSNLAPGLIKMRLPHIDIVSHRDYGLPLVSQKFLSKSLIILSSYSGNTEETIDSFHAVREKNLSCAVIATGGKLLHLAQKHSVPYVQIPDTGIQPRSALGYSLRALLALMQEQSILDETANLAETLEPKKFHDQGEALAKRMAGHIPVIYASTRNYSIAYNWKIKYNETGKIPAFCNVIPELNHNEMTGFDVTGATEHLSECFYFLFLADPLDHPQDAKRMSVLFDMFLKRNLRAEKIELSGESLFSKIFSSLVYADWSAFETALHYNLDPEKVPMIEEFKRKIA
ncbi:MAG: glucose/mannose-6-phosphate isomerase [Parcubacteria group bacterium Gr01-1014_48]|nr:MAG: glucose/mannose-6-phosphate isomerase [Parcubacteria group bacterium Greene0416_14]TSC74595.1 MAG: glucose/mannose-6-phosphate isomerase [Parcubacteria group bacterium Gr01-1014_48]TSD01606.1 MAG: glucose/mannose-6-phosphate isomerase [Parcubacteria group bacterium Greene1014_15]TSD08345.1 MAG: glucose/mannose-6-phosphate isomerase [Parcubacteria group bacterium Greene0714_4]